MYKEKYINKILEKAKITHCNKYNYSKMEYKGSNKKVTIICPIHGEFEQVIKNHLNGFGCYKCYINNRKLTTQQFIERAQRVHGDNYDYSKVDYVQSKDKITIICHEHGEFLQSPNSHLSGSMCDLCFKEKRKYNNNQFIERAQRVHGDNYDYSKVDYLGTHIKVIVTCKKHGDFEQEPSNHLQGFGCSKCNYENRKLTNEEFINRAKSIHGDKYDYSKVVYINAKTKVIITCKKHYDFEQNPFSHLNGVGCPKCKASKGELAIKAILDKHGIKNWQEYKIPDEKYLFKYDFYLPELNILIEFHGIQHYEYREFFHETYHDFEEQQMRDSNKITLAKEKSILLLEFNYKQFKYMTQEQFEELVVNKITRKTRS